MIIGNLLKIAWNAILLNKLRTLLTMLGVIIGVSSVILMLSIGEGSKESIRNQISEMGSNLINIRPGSRTMGGVNMGTESAEMLTIDDVDAIKEKSTALQGVSPVVTGNGQVINGSKNSPTSIYGVSEEYLSIKSMKIERGTMFNKIDVKTYSKVAVLGKTVVDNLFEAGEDPIGKLIRFKKIPLLVIGILEEKGESTFGMDQDDIILCPYTTVQKRILAIDYLNSIVASAASENVAEKAVIEISEILRIQHGIGPNESDDFNVFSMEEMIQTLSSTSELLSVLLVAIAGISLFVGGIGIMNIMYVSLKERTREIGLRLAVGAKSRDILFQFLVESVLISVTGGIFGVILGLVFSYALSSILGWPVIITYYSLIISFGVCAFTGVFFGWYPARKAAKLNPIEALRYE